MWQWIENTGKGKRFVHAQTRYPSFYVFFDSQYANSWTVVEPNVRRTNIEEKRKLSLNPSC